mmetsp:Transcript_20990/g.45978  ORF Transcript_20990/g.45978 Transcript_20990/m.45978 type:complete len:258 (-) Transcript_20990:675-1448(-)
MDQVIEKLKPLLEHVPPEYRHILETREAFLAIAVVAVTILLLTLSRLLRGSKSTARKISLVGACGSGKTVLFYNLVGAQVPEGTVSSMVENQGTITILNDKGQTAGSATAVDIPGHERLRVKRDQHLQETKAIVFLIDSVEITPHKVEAAEELFEVLTHPSVAKRRVPILLACNKMDLETQAHSVDFIKRTLEKQLDAMRKTRTSLSSEAAAKAAVLGKAEKPLVLSQLRNPISVASISALKGDVSEVHAFLRSTML